MNPLTIIFFLGLLICIVGILGIAISAAGINISQILDKKKRILAIILGCILMALAFCFSPIYYLDNDKDGHGNPNYSVSGLFNTNTSNYVSTHDDTDDDDAEIWNAGDAIAFYEDKDSDTFGNKNAKSINKNKNKKYPGFADNNLDCCDEDSGIWNAADAIAFYEDKDGDGYGNISSKPLYKNKNRKYEGLVDNNFDCYDNNFDAKPGQVHYFPKDRGDGSFDYDCDGNQSPATSNAIWKPSYSKNLATIVQDAWGNAGLTPGWLTIGSHQLGQSDKFVRGYKGPINNDADQLTYLDICDSTQCGR